MKRAFPFIVLCLALLMMGGVCGKSGSTDYQDTGNNGSSSGSCDANEAPTLAAIGFSVDGDYSENTATAAMDAEIALVLAYSDGSTGACNIGGGKLIVTTDGGNSDEMKVPGGLSCEQKTLADSGLAYPIEPLVVGSVTFSAVLEDLCGAQSNSLSATLDVTEAVGDDTADDTTTDDTADDDTATELEGSLAYYGDLTAEIVVVLLYTNWLPTALPAFTGLVTVPEAGFPFDYNLDISAVTDGDYYVSAYFDAVADDGVYNPDVDPTHSPWRAVTVTQGAVTQYDITLVDP